MPQYVVIRPEERARLVLWRVDEGLPWTAAAAQIGIAARTLKALEEGKPCKLSSVKRLADFHGRRVSELLEPELLGVG